MFIVRGLALSSSLFFLVYSALSLAVALGWKGIAFLLRRRSQQVLADSLFVIRILPLLVAALTTLLFVVPSFVLLEPRWSEERLGALPVVLGWAGLVLLLFGLWNTSKTVLRTARLVLAWSSGAQLVPCGGSIPVFRTAVLAGAGKEPPPVAVAGIIRPAVFISLAATTALSDSELQSVIRHETAHVRRRDNLKRLLFRLCSFPFLQRAEDAWADATEPAADDAAVSSAEEALDLASALVKLSFLMTSGSSLVSFNKHAPQHLTMALLHAGTSVPARVKRLISWSPPPAATRHGRIFYATTLVAACLFTLSYGSILASIHAITELLMQ